MPKTHAETYQPSPDPLLGLRVMGPASHRSATGEEDFKTFSDKCQRSPGPSSLSKWQGLAWCGRGQVGPFHTFPAGPPSPRALPKSHLHPDPKSHLPLQGSFQNTPLFSFSA